MNCKPSPDILDSLDLAGAVVSIDAMGTQTSIAKQIILKKFALAIVAEQKDKLSLRKRLFKAALNINYLKTLLKI